MSQRELALVVVRQEEVDGIDMGVLSDGTPYLAARGLARLAGVAPSAIITLGSDWETEKLKPRGIKVSTLIREQGVSPDSLFVAIKNNGITTHAYTDIVCMAILEYYAFESSSPNKETALQNYRLLARKSLRDFIYNRLGYDPNNLIPDSWKHFHDRVLINSSPSGYFSVFREIADMVVGSIQAGLVINPQTVPDISVGIGWAKHWKAGNLDRQYGERQKYPHNYPDYFPQAQANPHDAFIYPLEALGEFRIWMQNEYLPNAFPTYLKGKAKQGMFPPSSVELLLESLAPPKIKKLKGDEL